MPTTIKERLKSSQNLKNIEVENGQFGFNNFVGKSLRVANTFADETGWRNAIINDYLHKATAHVAKSCLTNKISKVVIGDVAKSLNHINLGKKTNQNFVNLSLGQFIEKLRYKLGQHGIELKVASESYTSAASFVDGDKMPKKYNEEAKPTYSGRRVKRGAEAKMASWLMLMLVVRIIF